MPQFEVILLKAAVARAAAGSSDSEAPAEAAWTRGRGRLHRQVSVVCAGMLVIVLPLSGLLLTLSRGSTERPGGGPISLSGARVAANSCKDPVRIIPGVIEESQAISAVRRAATPLVPLSGAVKEAYTIPGCQPDEAGSWRVVSGSTAAVVYGPADPSDDQWSLTVTFFAGAPASVGVEPWGFDAGLEQPSGAFDKAVYWTREQTDRLKDGAGTSTTIDAQSVRLDGSRSAEVLAGYAGNGAAIPSFTRGTAEAVLQAVIG